MKILIVNQPLNNRGDESAHKALVRSLLNTGVATSITVLFYKANPDSVRQFSVADSRVKYEIVTKGMGLLSIGKKAVRYNLPILFYMLPGSKTLIDFYKKTDMVVCAPGGICMGGFQNWTHLLYLYIAKWKKKPLAYFGRSIGPFPETTKLNRAFKRRSYEIMSYFTFFSIRDKESENLAKQIGVDYVPTVDTAFLDSPKVEIPLELKWIVEEKPYIIFVPNQLNWHFLYKNVANETIISFYGSILKEISERFGRIRIVMLPQTFNYQPEDNDVNYFKKLKTVYPQYDIVVVDDIYSSDIQQTIISNAELVVGARYHSVVFAINQAVPFVALSYEHKISGLLETLNKTYCMVDISNGLEAEKQSTYIKKFRQALAIAAPDKTICNKAKDIAKKSMNKFIQKISRI